MREAIQYCCTPRRLRRTITIALIVGTVLTTINQGDVILSGEAEAANWLKSAANYLVPFVVSNLGLLAGRPASVETAGGLGSPASGQGPAAHR